MSAIRILMLDDHSLFRESVSRLLESSPDLHIVGQCATVEEAQQLLAATPVDVVLLDYDLGEESGSRLLAEMKRSGSLTRVLMVTAGLSDEAMLQVMEAGAAGIFLKHSSPEQLVAAIHQVMSGGLWLKASAMEGLLGEKSSRIGPFERGRPLTQRQSEVLRGILDGLANKEIAWKLKTSESSVKAVIQELFHKAGVRTRSQLVRIAIEKRWPEWMKPAAGG